jgi:hypothetical protein
MMLGVLQLQAVPVTIPGTMNSPATFPFPIICRQVPHASTHNVVYGIEYDKVEAAYIDTARDLVREGAVAITTNCGFTVRYQKALARALSVPVSASSLLLLPYLLATTKGRLGILTFDSRPLTIDLLKLAGVESTAPIAIAGIDDSESWATLSKPAFELNVPQLARDVLSAIARMREQHPDVETLLFECTAFPLVANEVRAKTRLPVYDCLSNAKLLMSACGEPDSVR